MQHFESSMLNRRKCMYLTLVFGLCKWPFLALLYFSNGPFWHSSISQMALSGTPLFLKWPFLALLSFSNGPFWHSSLSQTALSGTPLFIKWPFLTLLSFSNGPFWHSSLSQMALSGTPPFLKRHKISYVCILSYPFSRSQIHDMPYITKINDVMVKVNVLELYTERLLDTTRHHFVKMYVQSVLVTVDSLPKL